MRQLVRWIQLITKKHNRLKKWRRIVTILAAVVTFMTTYALILPAITVEWENAADVSGMYLEPAEVLPEWEEAGPEEDALLPVSGEPAEAEAVEEAPLPGEEAAEEPGDAEALRTLSAAGDGYTVNLTYDGESGVPDGATLMVEEISGDSEEYAAYLEEAKRVMGLSGDAALPKRAARFFDIKIMDGGAEITPTSGVTVEVAYAEPLAETAGAEVAALHFPEADAEAEVIDASITGTGGDSLPAIEFTAESFSVYGIVYTVDFSYELGGTAYEFSIPGGGYLSLGELSEGLGIASPDVQGVEFSSPDLVWAGRVEAAATIGELKEMHGLACQYSGGLTEDDILEINAHTVCEGDWVLISLRPFASEETLCVTMKDGVWFEIRVTDEMVTNAGTVDYYISQGFRFYIFTTYQGDGSNSGDYYINSSGGWARDATYCKDGPTLRQTLGDEYLWTFTKDNTGHYVIRNVANPNQYLSLASYNPPVSGVNSAIFLNQRDNNIGFQLVNDDSSLALDFQDNYGSLYYTTVHRNYSWGAAMRMVPYEPTYEVAVNVQAPGTGAVQDGGGAAAESVQATVRQNGTNMNAIRAIPAPGYSFDYWAKNGSRQYGYPYASETIQQGSASLAQGDVLTAVFVKKTYDLALTQDDIARGYVTYTDTGAGVTKSTSQEAQTIIQYTAASDGASKTASYPISARVMNGYVFDHWEASDPGRVISWGASEDGTTAYSPETSTIRPTVTGNVTFTAHFAAAPFTVTAQPAGGGAVRVGNGAPGTTVSATSLNGHNEHEITAIPANGYTLAYWLLDGQELLVDGAPYTAAVIPAGTVPVMSGTVLKAVFLKDAYSISMTQNDISYGNVSCNYQTTAYWNQSLVQSTATNSDANKKASYPITANVTDGNYSFYYWDVSGDGEVVSWGDHGETRESPTIQPTVSGNVTLRAVFLQPGTTYWTYTITVDDPNLGLIASAQEFNGGNNSLIRRVNVPSLIGAASRRNGRPTGQVSAACRNGSGFLGWVLYDAYGNVVKTYDPADSAHYDPNFEYAILANSMYTITQNGMKLVAYYSETQSGGNTGGEPDPDTQAALSDMQSWLEDLTTASVSDVSKTAEVYDYDNRIYKIDVSASSGQKGADRSILINFITDTSRSMYFPANLVAANNVPMSSNFRLLSWLNAFGDTSKTYYVIGNKSTKATVYSVYNENNTWYYVDASYRGADDGMTRAGTLINSSTQFEDMDYTVYLAKYAREESTLWTRLDYLCMAVEIASQVVYQICPNAQIDVTTFNKMAEYKGTLPTDQAGIEALLRTISVGGGTQQDQGLDLAYAHFTPGSLKQQVAVLVTDGAPENTDSDYNTIEEMWDAIEGRASDLKGIYDAGGNPLKLFTLGLSIENVEGAEEKLRTLVATDADHAYAANDGEAIISAVKRLVMDLLTEVSVYGTVTDTLAPAFYPVTAEGEPISEGCYLPDGTKVDAPPGDGSIYHEWSYDEGSDTWTIAWHHQKIDWASGEEPGWRKSVYAKAKEDFLGGNRMETNVPAGSKVTAEGYYMSDGSAVPLTPSDTAFPEPLVNVDELGLVENSNTWTVYKGAEVDPEEQLRILWDSIRVKQVAKAGGVTPDRTRITGGSMQWYETNNGPADNGYPTRNYAELPIARDPETGLGYIDDSVFEALLASLDDGSTSSTYSTAATQIPYAPYGTTLGHLNVTLAKSVNAAAAADHAPGAHVTKEAGNNPEETYTLTVTYTPVSANAQEEYEHTTPGGSAGALTDEVASTNRHTVNVIERSLAITKVDASGNVLTADRVAAPEKDAVFTVYRAAGPGEAAATDSRLPAGGFTAVATITTNPATGIATWAPMEPIGNADGTGWLTLSEYYILETRAPGGYTPYGGSIRVTMEMLEHEDPVIIAPDGTALLFNLTQEADVNVYPDDPAVYITGISETGNPIGFRLRNDMTTDITVVKTDNAAEPDEIGGAVFKLSKDGAVQKGLTVVRADDGTTAVPVDPSTGCFTIPEGGVIIRGLSANAANKSYVLTEVSPPEGYIITIQPVEFTVDGTGAVIDVANAQNVGKVTYLDKQYRIQNAPGAVLPTTGGHGPQMFYLTGLLLALASGCALFVRRRLKKL